MIRAIVWKELQEQGLIALTLLMFGSALLVGVDMLADPPAPGAAPSDVFRFLGAGRIATLMLAVTAGMVCGGALYAGEREAGTMTFLESLPTSHRRIWRAKLIAGLALTQTQSALFLIVAVSLGLVPTFGWAITVLLYSLLAFVWGQFGSTSAQTTLGSVGMAIPAATATALVASIPVALFFQTPGSIVPRPLGGVLFFASMFITPLCLSYGLFTRADRDRAGSQKRPPRLRVPALCWLAFHQLFLPALVISAFAFVFGLCLLAPGLQPFLAWPGLALVAGTLTGVTAFSDEQSHGSARFWAEQRLPLGGVWLVKITFYLLFCLGLLILLVIPLSLRAQFSHVEELGINFGRTPLASIFNTQLMDQLRGQGWKYLLVPAIYGFAAGHLCGLLFKKWVVACAVAGIVAGTGTVLWIPSLLAGGVKHWQLWVPPVFLLISARFLIGAWSADRLQTIRPVAILIGGCLASVLTIAIGIGYRIVEIPNSPHGDDDANYVTQLMPIEDNVGGRDFKTAADRFAQVSVSVNAHFEKIGQSLASRHPGGGRPLRAEERLEQVPVLGWPSNDPSLEVWLDRLFAMQPTPKDDTPWYELAASAAAQPLGIYEHPQLIGAAGVSKTSLEYSRRMVVALLARGLLLQARGDSAAFLPDFQTALKLARTMRNGSVLACLLMGYEIERNALQALDRWIENLPPQANWLRAASAALPRPLLTVPEYFYMSATGAQCSQLLRTMTTFLVSCDSTQPFDPTPQFLAERHVLREALKAPTEWLSQQIAMPSDDLAGADAITDLVGLAWAVPWEKERTRRLVGLGPETPLGMDNPMIIGRPGANLLAARNRSPAELIELDRQVRVLRRAAILKCALQSFRAVNGKYPPTLEDLVPTGDLNQLPMDPYRDTESFGYRISDGKSLKSNSRNQTEGGLSREEIPERVVPAGQCLIWSKGPDRIDQAGTNPPIVLPKIGIKTADFVFLVPFR